MRRPVRAEAERIQPVDFAQRILQESKRLTWRDTFARVHGELPELERRLTDERWQALETVYEQTGCKLPKSIAQLLYRLIEYDIDAKEVVGGTFVHTADVVERLYDLLQQDEDLVMKPARETHITVPNLVHGATLHDIGKLAIPPEVLNDTTWNYKELFLDHVLPILLRDPRAYPEIAERVKKANGGKLPRGAEDIIIKDARSFRYLVPMDILWHVQNKTVTPDLMAFCRGSKTLQNMSLMDIIDQHQRISGDVTRRLPWEDRKEGGRVAQLAESHHQHLIESSATVAQGLDIARRNPFHTVASLVGLVDARAAIQRNARSYQRGDGKITTMAQLDHAQKSPRDVMVILGRMAQDNTFDPDITAQYIDVMKEEAGERVAA